MDTLFALRLAEEQSLQQRIVGFLRRLCADVSGRQSDAPERPSTSA